MISQEKLKELREEYKKGDRVSLIKMNDIQAPKIGTKGIVQYVDDIGTIHIKWDNGSTLGVVYGEDECFNITDDVRNEDADKDGKMTMYLYDDEEKMFTRLRQDLYIKIFFQGRADIGKKYWNQTKINIYENGTDYYTARYIIVTKNKKTLIAGINLSEVKANAIYSEKVLKCPIIIKEKDKGGKKK